MLNKKFLWFLSIVLIGSVGMRFNISILAWVMFVPLLLLARETHSKKSWFLLLFLLQIAYFLQIVKIITDPIPILMALMFSLPMALGSWVLLLVFEKSRRYVGDVWGVFLFASLMSVSEWLSFDSPLATWGAMLYTQLDDRAFLQFASLFGITFGSFFIYLSSAFVTVLVANKEKTPFIKHIAISSLIFLLFYGYGVWRIENGINTSKQVLLAGVVSQMHLTSKGIPSKEVVEKNTNTLLKKTLTAIKRGAKIIAWNEGATVIFKEDEESFKRQLQDISLQNDVELFIAYIVPLDGIKKFENKYLFLSKGKIFDEYFKFHPVMGEGSIKGEKFAKVIDVGYTKLSGAICYDFDFPILGRNLATKGTDIAIVPSSDWRGINTIHGLQAMVRAIEGGYALLRPVRGATSYAFDAYGNVRGSMSYYENNDKIMLASLPTKRVWTLYTLVGDIFPMGLLFFLGVVCVVGFRVGCRNM